MRDVVVFMIHMLQLYTQYTLLTHSIVSIVPLCLPTTVSETNLQHPWEAGVLQLRVWSRGTAFQLNYDKLTLAFNDLSGY